MVGAPEPAISISIRQARVMLSGINDEATFGVVQEASMLVELFQIKRCTRCAYLERCPGGCDLS